MKIIRNTLLLLLTLNLTYCGGSDTDSIVEPRTADDVRSDFQNLNIQPGINDITLESVVENVFWNFRIIAPSDASETNKRPLIISLHGGASNIFPEAHKSTACLIEPGFESLNAYIISPNSDGYFWYETPNQIQILALLDLSTQYLPIDPNKVIITGYSDGGNGAWFYADNYSDLFSAAIPMASSYNPFESDGSINKINIPMYVIHGESDELFPLAITEEWINESRGAGSSIEFFVAEGLSHFDVCDYVNYLQDAAFWAQTVVWGN